MRKRPREEESFKPKKARKVLKPKRQILTATQVTEHPIPMAMVTDVPGKQVFKDKKEAKAYAKAKGWKTFTFDGTKYHTSNGVAAKKGRKRGTKRRRYSRGYYGSGRGGDSFRVQNMYGRGDYTIPGPLGTLIGAGIGLAGDILGMGAYQVTSNSLVLGGDPPMIRNIDNGEAVVVRHREYIQDVLSGSSGAPNTTFSLQNFVIQPGNNITFPWLSQIAANFQEYVLLGVVFYYKSLSSEAVFSSASSGALGDVIMATNYNAAQANYANKVQMLESEFSSDAKPSKSFAHPIECAPNLTAVSNHLYVRTGAVPANQDQRLFDHGNFQIATQGCQANAATLGELWVTYEVAFYKPILGGIASGFDIPTDHFTLTSPTAASPLGGFQTKVPGSSIGTSITGRTLSFPAQLTEGSFLISWSVEGNTAQAIVYPSLTLIGCNQIAYWASGGSPSGAVSTTNSIVGGGNVVSSMQIGTVVVLTAGGATIQFGNGGTLPTTSTAGDLWITQINTNINS